MTKQTAPNLVGRPGTGRSDLADALRRFGQGKDLTELLHDPNLRHVSVGGDVLDRNLAGDFNIPEGTQVLVVIPDLHAPGVLDRPPTTDLSKLFDGRAQICDPNSRFWKPTKRK